MYDNTFFSAVLFDSEAVKISEYVGALGFQLTIKDIFAEKSE